MKKNMAFLLVLCLILSGCSSGTTEQTTTVQAETTTEAAAEAVPMTFEQLQEKYKRADWDVLLSDPVGFMRDFKNSFDHSKEEWIQDWSIFEPVEDSPDTLEADVVFFNRPFRLHVWENQYTGIGGNLYYESDDYDDCMDSYRKLFDSAIASLGDPKELSVKFDTVNEAEFRKAIGEPLKQFDGYDASWATTEMHLAINLYCYLDHATIQLY